MTKTKFRALSVHQPWAWSISAGHKKTENRTWTTNYRGPVAIHAGNNRERLRLLEEKLGSKFDGKMFPCGVVVGVAELVDVRPLSSGLEEDPDAVGPYCWLFERPRLLSSPVKAAGKTSLFYLSEEESAQVESSLDREISAATDGNAELVAATRFDPWELDFFRAETYWQAQQHEAVIRCCERAIRFDPTGLGPWQFKAMSLQALNRLQEAMTAVDQAIKLDDSVGGSYFARAAIPRIFGELLTTLERDKRGKRIILPLSQEIFSIPHNIFVLGTMNTADRSISLLDAALRRRFGFVELMPDGTVLGDSVVAGIPLRPWFDALNKRIREHVGRDARNLQIGHSYLMQSGSPLKDVASLKRAIRDEIIPLLEEYCYEKYDTLGSILGEQIVDVAAERIRHELFDDGQEDNLVQGLLAPFSDISTSAEAISSDESQADLDEGSEAEEQ
jgi:tetratricopeptide (TPR) repeat protein